jgi:homoserine kinase
VAPAFLAPAQVRVQVPATSANLGPGFDALGLALGMYDELDLRISSEPGLRIEAYGDAPTDETNLVVQGARAAFAAVGDQPVGLEMGYTARIPHARGLGSSAAAICAGVTGALALAGVRDRALALRLANEIEGHPDNVAAALYGGLTIAWTDGDGRAAAVRLDPAPGIVPVAFIPQRRTSTSESRGSLPATVTHADAARNAGRAALLVAALTSSPRDLMAATEDRLHQPFRLAGLREGAALIARLRAAGVPAVLSGSGPTILALCRDSAESAIAHGLSTGGFEPCELSIDQEGATCAAAEGEVATGSRRDG